MRLAALVFLAWWLALHEPARAEGWVIATLGTTGSTQECLDRARIALEATPAGRTETGEWAVFGYDLATPALDAVITCRPTGRGQEAVLVLYGVHDDAMGRRVIGESIRYFWQRSR